MKILLKGAGLLVAVLIAVTGCSSNAAGGEQVNAPTLKWTKIGATPTDGRDVYVSCYDGFTLFYTDTYIRAAEVTPAYRLNSGCANR